MTKGEHNYPRSLSFCVLRVYIHGFSSAQPAHSYTHEAHDLGQQIGVFGQIPNETTQSGPFRNRMVPVGLTESP